MLVENWSGRQDSNLRPPHPQCDALPGCATSRPPKTSPRPVEARLYGAGLAKSKRGFGRFDVASAGVQVIIAPDCFRTAPAQLTAPFLNHCRKDFRWIRFCYLELLQPGGAGGSAFFVQLVPTAFDLRRFLHVFLIRPQQKRAKEHEAKINAVQKNDEVVTGRRPDGQGNESC